ncbi:Aa-trans domain-containing protein [Aphelenchoides besseyi]|nr:Aa-trans domain-containing protein [Aphelenchoides besseyi]
MREQDEMDNKPLLAYEKQIDHHNSKSEGIGVFVGAMLIVADIAGGGIVALPMAFVKAGVVFGSTVIFIVAISFLFTAHLLADSYLCMRRRWPIYRRYCRQPYPEMAQRAFGRNFYKITSLVLNLMLFGVSVVYLLLSAKIISDLALSALNLKIGECRTIVLLALIFWPIIFFRSPSDFWFVVVIAMISTLLATGMILIGAMLDHSTCAPGARIPQYNYNESILSLGVFIFSFGGHSVFPLIMQDMRHPKHFSRSAVLAFLVVCILYVSITIVGVWTYGDSLTDTIITSIQSPHLRQYANLGIAIHCLLTLTITLNPLCQELEHALDVPHEFCFKRLFIRSALLFAVVFTSLSFPSFGIVLNLIGGTTVALTSAVFPCIFNLSLRATEHASPVEKYTWMELIRLIVNRTSSWRLAINGFIIIFATICGIATTKSALKEIAVSSFSPPCYYSSTVLELPTPQFVHCCGPFKNISSTISSVCHN